MALKCLRALALLPLLSLALFGQSRVLVMSDITNTIVSGAPTKSGGVHFPVGVSSFHEISRHQRNSTEHQDLYISWDSMNGATQILSLEAASRLPITGHFSLIQRKRNKPGTPNIFDPELAGDSIIIVGVTDSGEIRDIQSERDPRLFHSEDFRSNPVKRDDFVQPIATFQLQFSNDTAITQLLFLQQTAIMKPSDTGLKLLGKLNLNSEGLNPNPAK